MSRATKIAWAGSLVLVAALSAAGTAAATSVAPVSTSHGAPQIATLEPSTTTQVPAGWLGAGASAKTWEFHDLVLFESVAGYFGAGAGNCFMAAQRADMPEGETFNGSYSTNGSIWTGCGVGAFPPTLQLPVDSSLPPELRAEFADAVGLQFVKDGDRVGVFLDRG